MPNKSQPKSEMPASSTGWTKLSSLPGQKVDNAKYGFNYWRIENGVVWHQRWCLKKADPASFEIREDYSQIYIGRDINHVFYAQDIGLRNRQGTRSGPWKMAIGSTGIMPIANTRPPSPRSKDDVSHFKYIGGPYARDSVFAYNGVRVLKTCTAP